MLVMPLDKLVCLFIDGGDILKIQTIKNFVAPFPEKTSEINDLIQ
jgi:hypothetical protein